MTQLTESQKHNICSKEFQDEIHEMFEGQKNRVLEDRRILKSVVTCPGKKWGSNGKMICMPLLAFRGRERECKRPDLCQAIRSLSTKNYKWWEKPEFPARAFAWIDGHAPWQFDGVTQWPPKKEENAPCDKCH